MRQIAPAVYKLRKTIKNLLQPEAHYLLAVSGGADSLALAHACAALAAQGWGSYSVCHVEHGLRGEEALRDMQAVQRACKDWGLPCLQSMCRLHPMRHRTGFLPKMLRAACVMRRLGA